jgi:Fe-Mn family superoxide dismutase
LNPDLKEKLMSIELPDLPYAADALEPHVSANTLGFHHGKHHKAYVDKLNAAIGGTKYEGQALEAIITASHEAADMGVFNNAAQIWNHTFLWNSMSPDGGGEPQGALAEAINASFGDLAGFREKFKASAMGQFGSGWTWLVKNAAGGLEIVNTGNADSALKKGTPVVTIDVWEHAYYIDKRNARPAYVESWWNVVDWNVAAKNFAG